ncbi:MAG: hypothetical protein WBD78_01720 [Methylocella sp.]
MFQLHYGGMSNQFPHPGLGDTFTQQTGLSAQDPSTWQQQIDFSLQQLAAGKGPQWSTYAKASAGLSSNATSDYSSGDTAAPLDTGPGAVSDAQLTALGGYYGANQQDAYDDYQNDLADGSAPSPSDLNGIAAPSASTAIPTNANGTFSTAGAGNPFASAINSAAGLIPGPAGQALKSVLPALTGSGGILSALTGGTSTSLPGPLSSMFGGSGSGGLPSFAQIAGQNVSPSALATQGSPTGSITGTNAGGGVPVDITDTTSVASTGLNAAAQSVGKLTQGVGQDTSTLTKGAAQDTQAATQSLTQNTQSAEQTGTSWVNTLSNLAEGPTGLLPRFGAILLAGIMIAFALWMAGTGAVKRGV